MGVAACIVSAVATKEMSAGGNAMIGELVRKVTILANWTRTRAKEVFADGDLGGIMGESARRTEGTITCDTQSVQNMGGAYRLCFARKGPQGVSASA